MDLYWVEVGNPESDHTIIFLHEGLGCVGMWKDYPQQLCNALDVRGIVYDRAGYGKSSGSLKDRTHTYLHDGANELRSLIDHLNIQVPILYGHSDGGSISLIYAAEYPKEVKCVITEASHVFNEQETTNGVLNARPWLDEGKMEGLRKYHGDRYDEVFYAWNDIWLHESFKNWNIEDLLPKVVAPTLVIQGLDDEYGTLKQVETIAAKTLGESRVLTPANCAHSPYKQQTELVMHEAVSFIREFL